MTTTSSPSSPVSLRALILGVLLVTSSVTAFAPPPARLRSPLSKAITRDLPEVLRTRIERSASFTVGDSATPSLSRKAAAGFGWTGKKAARAGGVRIAGSGGLSQQRHQGDWSKLFAAPEPAAEARKRPLISGISRSRAALAQGGCGSTQIFFGMVMLVYAFAPWFAAQSLVAWGVGRVTYWLSMRDADVSQRLPAGLVGYMSLFLLVGGLSFMNGLKAVALLS